MILSRRRFLGLAPPALWHGCGVDTRGVEGEGEGEGEGAGEGEGEGEAPLWRDDGTAVLTAGLVDDDAIDDLCALTCDLTVGPCFAASPERKDISEGARGVPLLMRLQIVEVDAGCVPIAGTVVDVWHCGVDGLYTGDEVVAACRQNLDEPATRRTFRGTQVADESGVVEFQSCFPGWYPRPRCARAPQGKQRAGQRGDPAVFRRSHHRVDRGHRARVCGAWRARHRPRLRPFGERTRAAAVSVSFAGRARRFGGRQDGWVVAPVALLSTCTFLARRGESRLGDKLTQFDQLRSNSL